MEDKNLGQLNERVAHLCFRFLIALLASVVIIKGVLRHLVLKALNQGRLVLQRLRHEWIASHRLVLTLAAFDNRLLKSHEDFVNNRRVARAK